MAQVALVALVALAAAACNPMVDQPTVVAGPGWRTHHYTYRGPAAWLAVRVDQDTGITGTLTAAGQASLGPTGATQCVADGPGGTDATAPCGGCLLTSPDRVVWSDGASRGYRRLFLMHDGDPIRVAFTGTAPSVMADLAATDDAGQPIAAAELHDDTGPFDPVPWEIC